MTEMRLTRRGAVFIGLHDAGPSTCKEIISIVNAAMENGALIDRSDDPMRYEEVYRHLRALLRDGLISSAKGDLGAVLWWSNTRPDS